MRASRTLQRAKDFAARIGIRVPILLAPMAGACPPSLSIAVGNAGGLGSCGALLMSPQHMRAWATELRAGSNGGFQINLWVPDPAPVRDEAVEAPMRALLAQWGPQVLTAAGDAVPPDFAQQCEALFEIAPPIVSSVMGLYPAEIVARLKAKGILWIAHVTTVAEAKAAVAAGADIVAVQGMEAGGHRGAFEAATAEARMVGLFALIPAVVDAVDVPVVAAGGIADARGVAAALTLGASAVAIGTGFLRAPEAKIASAWADALGRAMPEDTMVTRAFSGRAGRSLATSYVRAASASGAPAAAPYPVQRGLTQGMRDAAVAAGDVERMQAWAGQSCALARAAPAAQILVDVWNGAQELLS